MRLSRVLLWPARSTPPKPYLRPGNIAQKFSQASDHAKTREVLDEADGVAQQIPQPDQRRLALEKVHGLTGTLPRPPR